MDKLSRPRRLWNGIKNQTRKFFHLFSKKNSSAPDNPSKINPVALDTPTLNSLDNTVCLASPDSQIHDVTGPISLQNSDGIDSTVPFDTLSVTTSYKNLAKILEPLKDSLGSQSLKRPRSLSDSVSLPALKSIKSSCSNIVRGSSSTYEHCDQESFATCKPKIIQLCHDIGFGEPSKIECMTGGDYNRVFSLAFSSKDNQHYVLRVPRYPETTRSTKDQAAVLHYLASLMPVPTVMAFDSTSANAIECPYVFQRKIIGTTASEVYYNLPLKEKIELISIMAGLMNKMKAIKADRPGQFIAGPSFPSLSHGPLTIPADVDIVGYRSDRETVSYMPRIDKQPLESHLISIFENRKQRDIDGDRLFMEDNWDTLQKIANEMKAAGLIHNTDADCVIWHWDIAFRNILVEKQATGDWAMTGVLDWDGLLAVPLVVTRAPPVWLWINENCRSTKYHDALCDDDVQPSRELNLEELTLKGYFEQIMQRSDPHYMSDAYGRGIWIRRLAEFAVHGFCTNEHYHKIEKFVSEWKEHCKFLGFETDIDESDGEDDDSDTDEGDGDENDSDGSDTDEQQFSIASESPRSSCKSNQLSQSSASSTFEYDQESFDTFKSKVIQLFHDIGFGKPSNVERMDGGDYNRVIGVTFSGQSEDRHFVLRIPRHALEENEAYTIRDQAATLLFLKQFDFLCTPTIAAIDTTLMNVIESQYVLHERLVGKPLQDVLFTLPLAEKLELMTVAAKLFIKMESITIKEPGVLSGTQSLPWTSTSLPLSASEPTISGFNFNYRKVSSPFRQQSLAHLLSNLLNEQRKKYVLSPNQLLKWDKLLAIIEEMKQSGLFRHSDITNVLWHWDICARHIFVDKDESSLTPITATSDSTSDITKPHNFDHSNGKVDEEMLGFTNDTSEFPATQAQITSSVWKVTGVIDWDDAKSVPLVLTRVPRTWLWFNEVERTDSWDGNRDCPPERALTQEELTIKAHFDQLMQQADPEYLNDTYFRGVWIRRLFRFAQSGIHDTTDFVRYNKFVEDWETYFKGHILMTL